MRVIYTFQCVPVSNYSKFMVSNYQIYLDIRYTRYQESHLTFQTKRNWQGRFPTALPPSVVSLLTTSNNPTCLFVPPLFCLYGWARRSWTHVVKKLGFVLFRFSIFGKIFLFPKQLSRVKALPAIDGRSVLFQTNHFYSIFRMHFSSKIDLYFSFPWSYVTNSSEGDKKNITDPDPLKRSISLYQSRFHFWNIISVGL